MKLRKATHIGDALKPVLESLGIAGDSVKRELLSPTALSQCCDAKLSFIGHVHDKVLYSCSACGQRELLP